MRTVHFGACADFSRCPKLYQLAHLERWGQLQTGRAIERGSALHRALDKLAQGLPLSQAEEALLTPIYNFYQTLVAAYAGLPVYSEWAFTIPLSLPRERVIVTGRIDRWYQNNDRLIVLDWKSGAPPRQPQTHLLQMRFYAWALWQYHRGRQPIQAIEAQWVYLDHGHIERVHFEAHELEGATLDWQDLISQMDPNTHQFVPQPQTFAGVPWCQQCHFQQLCPEGKQYHGRHEESDVALQAAGPDLPRL
jgi:hypothetical protein